MNPEQRLSIREAVELIAQHGEKPISESALRSRAKTKRLGVSRVNGRIYTNPLNLASAGLIPIGVVTASVVPKTIDDDELHAWLDSPIEDLRRDTPGPLERLLNDRPDVEPLGPGEPEGSTELGDAEQPTSEPRPGGDFEDTLDDFVGEGPPTPDPPRQSENVGESVREASRPTESDVPNEDSGPASRAAAHRQTVAPSSRSRHGSANSRLRLAAAVAIAAAIAVVVAITLPARESSGPQALQASTNAATEAQLEQRRRATAIADAGRRGDYDGAMRLASFSGDRAAYDAARSDATRTLLGRARRALADDKIKTARRYVHRAEKRYGDPDPSGRRSVEQRIRRAERAAERDRARAAEARRAQRALTAARRAAPAPAPAAQQAASPAPRTATPAPNTATPSGSSAAGTATEKPKSQIPAPSSSGSKSDARDPEFF